MASSICASRAVAVTAPATSATRDFALIFHLAFRLFDFSTFRLAPLPSPNPPIYYGPALSLQAYLADGPLTEDGLHKTRVAGDEPSAARSLRIQTRRDEIPQ